MEETQEARRLAGSESDTDNSNAADTRERCECKEKQENHNQEEDAVCYVLMNSARYGTEAWLCTSLEAAVQTLARLARNAEQRRQTDGIQRYFCIKGRDLPTQEEPVGSEPVSPILPDADALTLTLHRRETCHCPMSQDVYERDMREVVRLLCHEDAEADKQASLRAGHEEAREVGA